MIRFFFPIICVIIFSRPILSLDGWALITSTIWFGFGDLYLVNCKDNKSTKIASGSIGAAIFSPDGQRIAYSDNKNGKIYVVNSSDPLGTKIEHTANCTGVTQWLSWVQRGGKEYIYYATEGSSLRRVEVGTNTVETVYTGHTIVGHVALDGIRAGLSIDDTWDPRSVNLETKTDKLVGNGTQCQASISIDGQWVSGNCEGHRRAIICKYWEHDQLTAINSPGGAEFNVHRFSRTSPEYFLFTVSTNKPYVCKWKSGEMIEIKFSGFMHDYFNGQFGPVRPTVKPPLFSPASGAVENTQQKVIISCETEGAEIRYTIDGSTPSASNGIKISSGSSFDLSIPEGGQKIVKAIGLKDGMEPSPVVTVIYSHMKLREPENPANVVKGVEYKYYTGNFLSLMAMETTSPADSGISETIDITKAKRAENFGLIFNGYLYVSTSGIYTFFLISDDSSAFYIGAQRVVGAAWNSGECSGSIGLKEGKHAFKLLYNQGIGEKYLTLSYEAPGSKKVQIPASEFYRKRPQHAPVTVIWPNGGEQLIVGQQVTIKWSTDTTIVPNIRIEISQNNGKSWWPLEASGSIDYRKSGWGEYLWTVQEKIENGDVSLLSSECRIKVAAYQGNDFDISDAAFTIANQQPSSTIGKQYRKEHSLIYDVIEMVGLDGRIIARKDVGKDSFGNVKVAKGVYILRKTSVIKHTKMTIGIYKE